MKQYKVVRQTLSYTVTVHSSRNTLSRDRVAGGAAARYHSPPLSSLLSPLNTISVTLHSDPSHW